MEGGEGGFVIKRDIIYFCIGGYSIGGLTITLEIRPDTAQALYTNAPYIWCNSWFLQSLEFIALLLCDIRLK